MLVLQFVCNHISARIKDQGNHGYIVYDVYIFVIVDVFTVLALLTLILVTTGCIFLYLNVYYCLLFPFLLKPYWLVPIPKEIFREQSHFLFIHKGGTTETENSKSTEREYTMWDILHQRRFHWKFYRIGFYTSAKSWTIKSFLSKKNDFHWKYLSCTFHKNS